MLYAMMQAERVPALEYENRELKEKIKESGQLHKLQARNKPFK
jgi:hypothetical protein